MNDRSDESPIVIALVAPIGVNLDLIKNEISNAFHTQDIDHVKISKLFDDNSYKDVKHEQHCQSKTENCMYCNISRKMDIGDYIRSKDTKDSNKIAQYALDQISDNSSKNKIYIFDQLKTPEEIVYLRAHLNKAILFVVSIFDTKANRLLFLESKLKGSVLNHEANESLESLATKLINRDEKDPLKKYGQNTRDSFSLADFFIDASINCSLNDQIERIYKIIFSNPHISPLKDEYGMYMADAAALRSRDLSRQVGACILNKEGSVIAVGCNEVPKAFGGTYWEGEKNDNRDFQLGIDSNYMYRNRMLYELFSTLTDLEESILTTDFKDKVMAKGKEGVVNFISNNESQLKNTRLMNIIEFGRSNHAEIDAISSAARNGYSVKGSILYTTVFPCHLCARYIINAGIEQIIFIEAYPKSLTLELYKTETCLTNDCESNTKVALRSFIGVSPRIYRTAFHYNKHNEGDKKNLTGESKPWIKSIKKWL